nr:PAS domain-containing protein [Rhizobium sp. P38BS-XIX]
MFTWPLTDNIVYGDTAIAFLFGLDPAKTLLGVTARRYIRRIFVSDRSIVINLWMQAITTGRSFHVEFRVRDETGHYRHVASSGRCFRNADGVPAHFIGIVYPLGH